MVKVMPIGAESVPTVQLYPRFRPATPPETSTFSRTLMLALGTDGSILPTASSVATTCALTYPTLPRTVIGITAPGNTIPDLGISTFPSASTEPVKEVTWSPVGVRSICVAPMLIEPEVGLIVMGPGFATVAASAPGTRIPARSVATTSAKPIRRLKPVAPMWSLLRTGSPRPDQGTSLAIAGSASQATSIGPARCRLARCSGHGAGDHRHDRPERGA